MALADETWAVTGAAGAIGTVLCRALEERVGWLRRLDTRAAESVARVDVTDREALLAAFTGVHGVVHLAAIPGEADFRRLAEVNIVGTANVFEAALHAGARRVVFASTNHVTGLYPVSAAVDPGVPVRPDSLYGVSKVAGEALGRLYAEKLGLEVACLRIGTFAAAPAEARDLSTWLSEGDAVRAFLAAMTAEPLGFEVFYAVSANARSWWDPAARGAELGYEPQDDAEALAATVPAPTLEEAAAPQGGRFASPEYTLRHLR